MGALLSPQASMADITGRYLGRPFTDISCLELVCRIYRDDLGVDFPEAFAGVTRVDFLERWRRHRRGLESLMLRFFRGIGEPVDVRRPRRWDLLALMGRTRAVFPAVCTGRGHAITSTIQEGVVIVPITTVNRPLLARRLVHG